MGDAFRHISVDSPLTRQVGPPQTYAGLPSPLLGAALSGFDWCSFQCVRDESATYTFLLSDMTIIIGDAHGEPASAAGPRTTSTEAC